MIRKILFVVLLGMVAVMTPSCGGSKKTSGMRQIEKHSRKYPVDENGVPAPTSGSDSKKVRQAIANQKKQEEAAKKEADKAYKDGITRHRAFQTQETRERMDQHLKESNKRYSNQKEFFLVRWFRPSNDVDKIEKRRAKEVQKRMAATRKTAEKNNEARSTSSFKTKERKSSRPDPADIQHGGGGTYKESGATRYASPSDMQMGGGGTYISGKSNSKAKPSDIQQGGGGNFQKVKSKKKDKQSKK